MKSDERDTKDPPAFLPPSGRHSVKVSVMGDCVCPHPHSSKLPRNFRLLQKATNPYAKRSGPSGRGEQGMAWLSSTFLPSREHAGAEKLEEKIH